MFEERQKYLILDNRLRLNGEIVRYDIDKHDGVEEIFAYEGIDIDDFFEKNIQEFPNETIFKIYDGNYCTKLIKGYGVIRSEEVSFICLDLSHTTEDLTFTEGFGKWNFKHFLSTLETVIRSVEYFDIISSFTFDGYDYSLLIACRIDEKQNIRKSFFEANKKFDDLVSRVTSILEGEEGIRGRLKIKLPHILKSPIRQFLIFFEDFVYQAKRKVIEVNPKNTDDGISVELSYDETEIEEEAVINWLQEYVSIVRKNTSTNNIDVKFTYEPTEIESNYLFVSLQNQIANLKNSLSIANLALQQQGIQRGMMTLDSIMGEIPKLNSEPFNNLSIIEIKDMLSTEKYDELFRALKKRLIDDNNLYNDVIVCQSRSFKIEKDFSQGLITVEKRNSLMTQVKISILKIIDELPPTSAVRTTS